MAVTKASQSACSSEARAGSGKSEKKKKDKWVVMFGRKSLRDKTQKMFENVEQPSCYQCWSSQGQELMTVKDLETALKSPVLKVVSKRNYRSTGGERVGAV